MFAAVPLLCVLAQDAQTPPPVPAPSPRRLELSIFDAIRSAVDNDLTLKIEQLAGDVAHYTYEGSWGVFDPVWRASAQWSDAQLERQSGLPPPQPPVFTINSERWEVGTGLNFPLTTGGAFDLSIAQSTSDTKFPGFIAAPDQSFVGDTLALSFTQPLLRGGGSNYATSVQRESDLRNRKEIERIRQVRQDLVQRVANAYWDLVAALKQLEVAEETLALGREQVDQNRRRLEAGVGTEVEVLQADTNVAQRIEQKLAREVLAKGAADRLKGLMTPGTKVASWEVEIVPVTDLPQADPAEVPEWTQALDRALQHRAELKQQLFEIDASEEGLVRAKSERKPMLDFVVSGQSDSVERNEGQALHGAVSWEFPTYSAGLSFSTPIGNRSALYAEKMARASVRAARLVYDQLESQIVEDVRAAVRQTNYSIEAVRAAAASTELARRQLAAEQTRYREGLSTNFQVLEFQQQLAESLYSHTLARANLAKALTALRRSQGTLGDEVP